MRRYFHIFLNYLQIVITERGRSFVWFLVSTIPPLAVYLYWRAVFMSKTDVGGWTLPTISSYYFLLIIASSALIAHIEEDVSYDDIQGGQLSSFILKPFPYFLIKFFTETPYRILQGLYAIIPLVIFFLLFKSSFAFSNDPLTLIFASLIAVLGYLLSFSFKMVIGIITFWLTDARGLYQLVEACMFILAGFMVPITLLPGFLPTIASILPFSYMLYYPITAFQGKYNIQELVQIVFIQLLWVFIMALLYKWTWSQGIKKFTGVGN